MVVILDLYMDFGPDCDVSLRRFGSTMGQLLAMDVSSFFLNSVFSRPVYQAGQPLGILYRTNSFSSYVNPLGLVLKGKRQFLVYLVIRLGLAAALIGFPFLRVCGGVRAHKYTPGKEWRIQVKLKKINAALGLLSLAGMLVHIGYTVFAYLTFYYNPAMKLLTAFPFMVATCLHAVCGMMVVFLHSDGTRLDMYPKQTLRTILQRVSAALILPLLFLHIKTFDLLQSTAATRQWLWFALLLISQPLFYGTALTHIAVSVTRALITLGWLTSRDRQKAIDRAIYILCAVIFVIATFVVLRTELAMFLSGGGAA